jgi:hypothetical protein
MEAALDRSDLRTGLPARTYPAPAVVEGPQGRWANALVPAAPPAPPEGGRRRYLIPAVLLAGWGGLFAYCATYLREDLPFRPQSGTEATRRAEDPSRPVVVLPEVPDEPSRLAAAPAREAERPAAVAAVAPPPVSAAIAPQAAAAPRPAASPAADYVGTWGPTPAACGSPSRRRGYLPATITADRARAGRTSCSFHDGRRTGNGWVMAADCSDRGRRWTSQVRLVVDGDRLTWTSSRGTAAYVRCSRRAG